MLVSHDSEVDDIAMLVTIFVRKKDVGNIILHVGDIPIGRCLARVTNIPNLSATHLVSNIRHQHQKLQNRFGEFLY